jgi:hypothetical protein
VHGVFKDFNYVCRRLYCFPVTLPYADSTDTTITFTHAYPIAKLRAIAFIQNLKNSSPEFKKVYQSAAAPFQIRQP